QAPGAWGRGREGKTDALYRAGLRNLKLEIRRHSRTAEHALEVEEARVVPRLPGKHTRLVRPEALQHGEVRAAVEPAGENQVFPVVAPGHFHKDQGKALRDPLVTLARLVTPAAADHFPHVVDELVGGLDRQAHEKDFGVAERAEQPDGVGEAGAFPVRR